MKIWFIIIAAAAMWLSVRLPFEKTDVAKLTPVSVLLVERSGGKLVVTSDLGNTGVGETLDQALEDMELTSSGRIFLDTVEQLIVSDAAAMHAEDLTDHFRPGTYICACSESIDPAEAGKYLQLRKEKPTLRDYEMGEGALPVLIQIDGRFYLDG